MYKHVLWINDFCINRGCVQFDTLKYFYNGQGVLPFLSAQYSLNLLMVKTSTTEINHFTILHDLYESAELQLSILQSTIENKMPKSY